MKFLDNLATALLGFLWITILFVGTLALTLWSIKWLISALSALGVL